MTNGSGQIQPQFWQAIIAALETRGPKPLLTKLLLRHWQVHLSNLVDTDSPPEQWLFALFSRANTEGRLEFLLQLIKAWSVDPQIRNAIDAALGPLANIRSRWYDEYMPMDMPFINRVDLREKLYDVLERKPQDKRLMIVRGESWGKSHSRWLLKHVASEIGFQEPVYVDLLQVPSLEELTELLVTELGLPFNAFKERFTTPVRNVKQFCSWFKGQTLAFSQLDQRWIIIFDHLCKSGVSQEILDLALNLGQQAYSRDLTNVWVVLLDCPPVETLRHPSRRQEELVTPISKQQVEALVMWVMQVRKMLGDPAPDPPEAIANILQTGVFPLKKEELESLEQNIASWWCTPPGTLGGVQ
jgi:hypothetical protein